MLRNQEKDLLEEKGICFMFTLDLERDNTPHGGLYEGVKAMPRILDFWDTYNVKATVFTTGDVARKYPDLVRELSVKHEVGCHMNDHEPLVPTPYDERRSSLSELEHALAAATRTLSAVKKPSCFRAPYLAFTPDFIPLLLQQGYTISSSTPASHSRGLVVLREIIEICVSASLSLEPSLRYDVFSLENLMLRGEHLLRGLFDLLILKSVTVPVFPVVFLCHSWEIDSSSLSCIGSMLEAFPDNTTFDLMSEVGKQYVVT